MKDTTPACQKLREERGHHSQGEGARTEVQGAAGAQGSYLRDFSYVLLSRASKRPRLVSQLLPQPKAPYSPHTEACSVGQYRAHLPSPPGGHGVFPISTPNPQK